MYGYDLVADINKLGENSSQTLKKKYNEGRRLFYNRSFLDMCVLKPLWHIRDVRDLSWYEKTKRYTVEDDSFGKEINDLIMEFENINPPDNYHEHVDKLAEYLAAKLTRGIKKIKNRFDEIEEGHAVILSNIISIILYYRNNAK